MKLKNAVDSTNLSEAVKEYTLPATHAIEGVSVPVSPVVIVDPSSAPHRLVPQGWWLYQATRVATMAGGGGAEAFRVNIVLNPGQVARLVVANMVGAASAGATLQIWLLDEDSANFARLADVAAGASRTVCLPALGGTAATNANTLTQPNLMLGPGMILSFRSSVAANAETITVSICLLLSTQTLPVWNLTGSGGTPTLAASTISAANTLQKVDLPW